MKTRQILQEFDQWMVKNQSFKYEPMSHHRGENGYAIIGKEISEELKEYNIVFRAADEEPTFGCITWVIECIIYKEIRDANLRGSDITKLEKMVVGESYEGVFEALDDALLKLERKLKKQG